MFYCMIVTLAWIVWHLVFRITVIGKENLIKDRGFVLAPNHLSAIDPVFVVIARFWGKRMVVFGKEELFGKNIFLDWMWRHVNVVCVHRGKGDTQVVDDAIENVKNGQGLLIFPEGTRSKDGNLGRLKSGAFVVAAAAGVDMIPCRIIYEGGRPKVFGRCMIVFGKPIPAAQLALGEPRSAAKLRAGKALLEEKLQNLWEENRHSI